MNNAKLPDTTTVFPPKATSFSVCESPSIAEITISFVTESFSSNEKSAAPSTYRFPVMLIFTEDDIAPEKITSGDSIWISFPDNVPEFSKLDDVTVMLPLSAVIVPAFVNDFAFTLMAPFSAVIFPGFVKSLFGASKVNPFSKLLSVPKKETVPSVDLILTASVNTKSPL